MLKKINDNETFWTVMYFVTVWLTLALVTSMIEGIIPMFTGEWSGYSSYYTYLCMMSNLKMCFILTARIGSVYLVWKMLNK